MHKYLLRRELRPKSKQKNEQREERIEIFILSRENVTVLELIFMRNRI